MPEEKMVENFNTLNDSFDGNIAGLKVQVKAEVGDRIFTFICFVLNL